MLEIGPLTQGELAPGLEWSAWRADDALERLRQAGLVRDGDLVTPTRRAFDLRL
jgi:hypothetical protein